MSNGTYSTELTGVESRSPHAATAVCLPCPWIWSHSSSATSRGISKAAGSYARRKHKRSTDTDRQGTSRLETFSTNRAWPATRLQTFPPAPRARPPRASLAQPALPTAASIPRSFFCYCLTKLLIFHSRFIHNYITRKLNSITENYLNQSPNLAEYVNHSFKSLAAKIHWWQKLLTK